MVSSYVSRGMSPYSGERRSFCSKHTGCDFCFLILSINPAQGTEEGKFQLVTFTFGDKQAIPLAQKARHFC